MKGKVCPVNSQKTAMILSKQQRKPLKRAQQKQQKLSEQNGARHIERVNSICPNPELTTSFYKRERKRASMQFDKVKTWKISSLISQK
ncbi:MULTISPECIES: hypothetical protein [unclassified Prochlorococcus]|uniref:hypothetical protein n=1 Tax=unclassified Prochlorococcus TaxID=2627481 RepID=UPI0012685E12|nr:MULTISPECIES: hypothetical protein [unclassified Prochlorococcus]